MGPLHLPEKPARRHVDEAAARGLAEVEPLDDAVGDERLQELGRRHEALIAREGVRRAGWCQGQRGLGAPVDDLVERAVAADHDNQRRAPVGPGGDGLRRAALGGERCGDGVAAPAEPALDSRGERGAVPAA